MSEEIILEYSDPEKEECLRTHSRTWCRETGYGRYRVVSFKVPPHVVEKLDSIARSMRIPRSELLRMIVLEYLRKKGLEA